MFGQHVFFWQHFTSSRLLLRICADANCEGLSIEIRDPATTKCFYQGAAANNPNATLCSIETSTCSVTPKDVCCTDGTGTGTTCANCCTTTTTTTTTTTQADCDEEMGNFTQVFGASPNKQKTRSEPFKGVVWSVLIFWYGNPVNNTFWAVL